jgi:hypothetical protein
MNAKRIFSLSAGGVATLLGVLALVAGSALIVVHQNERDGDGYYGSAGQRLSTGGYALTARDVDLGGPADSVPEDVLGRVRIRAERVGGGPVFVGVGPEREVDAYLKGVAQSEVDDPTADPPEYVNHRGGAPEGRPGAQDFWVARAEGSGRRTVSWDAENGRWAAVAMNADGSRGVSLDADIGARIGWLLGVGIGFVVLGVLLTLGGALLLVLGTRRPRAEQAIGLPTMAA